MLGGAGRWSLGVSWRGRRGRCELCDERAIGRHPEVLSELHREVERGA